MDGSHPTQEFQTQSSVSASDCLSRVPLITNYPILEGDTHSHSPSVDITNVEFHYSINLLTQLVISQS